MQRPLNTLAQEPPRTIPATRGGSSTRSAPRIGTLPAVGGSLFLGLLVLILLFQWNWLRGPLAGYLGGQLHRPVAINGDLKVHPWSWSPWATLDDVTVGNPSWARGGMMARLPRLKVQIRLAPLLGGRLVMPLVEADRPDVRLFTDPAGRSNWADGKSAKPQNLPAIGRLVISGGTVRYANAKRRLAFVGAVSSDERASGPARGISTVEGALTIGNPAWAGPGPMARVPRVLAKVGLLPLMRGTTVIPLIEADRPDVRLVRDAAGRNNWTFDTAKPKPLKAPPIGRLVIRDGALRYDDARKGLSFAGRASSSETLTGASRGVFLLEGQGLLKKARFVARLSGGPLVHVDPTRPYPFDARIEAGATRVAVTGRLARPFEFSALSGSVHVSGLDFADLYHITDVALPSTPPYDLTAGFARSGALYAFRGIHGRVGDSDLGGALSVDGRTGRPFVKADLVSRRLKLADLSAVIGGAPKTLAGHTVSPAQRAMAVKLRAEHRLFPDARLEVGRMRTTDARLTYAAQSVDAGRLPIRNLSLRLALDHGLLTIDPLAMGMPQGQLAGNIRLDARGAVPAEAIDMRLTNARVENLIGRGGAKPALEGGLFGRAKLTGTGDSVRAAAASANGAVSVVMPRGQIRQSLAELLGIDVTKGLFLLISKNKGETPVRCAVADFTAQNGVLTARRIVLDTGVVLALGGGRIDLRNETMDLRLNGKPKKFRLVRIAAPITVKGRLESPKFGVDVGKAAPQLLISGLLATVVAPLAAILPFVNAGLAKDADCAALTAGR